MVKKYVTKAYARFTEDPVRTIGHISIATTSWWMAKSEWRRGLRISSAHARGLAYTSKEVLKAARLGNVPFAWEAAVPGTAALSLMAITVVGIPTMAAVAPDIAKHTYQTSMSGQPSVGSGGSWLLTPGTKSFF